MALGVARQMDRCRTVGNSVVPICVGVAWRVLTGLRHAVNPRDTPAPPPSRSKHRLDPNRRVPLMTPDPRVRPNWDGGGGNEAPWKPWSVPWPTFFAPVQNESPSTDPRTDPQTGSKRKRQEGGDGGQTESETAATPDDRGDVPSPPVLDKLEPWGETEEAKARRLEARRGGGTNVGPPLRPQQRVGKNPRRDRRRNKLGRRWTPSSPPPTSGTARPRCSDSCGSPRYATMRSTAASPRRSGHPPRSGGPPRGVTWSRCGGLRSRRLGCSRHPPRFATVGWRRKSAVGQAWWSV